jgi:hypothetical protein
MDLPSGPRTRACGTVFAAALHVAEEFDLVELVGALGVAQAPEALFAGDFVDHDVEAVEGVEEAVGADGGRFAAGGLRALRSGRGLEVGHIGNRGQGGGELLNLGAGGRAEGGRRDAVEAAVLVGGDDAAFGIDGEGDPRALVFFRDGVEELDLETGRDGERGRLGGGGDRGHGGAGGLARGLGGGGVGGFLSGLGFFLRRLRGERDGGEAEEEQRAEARESGVERAGWCHGLGKGEGRRAEKFGGGTANLR